MLEAAVQDLRHGWRVLKAAPVVSAAAIVTIALGIGGAVGVFSAVNATLLRPLPYARSHELVELQTRYTDGRATSGLLSHAELLALANDGTGLTTATSFGIPLDASIVLDDGAPVSIVAAGVTEHFFETFAAPLRLGRAFTAEDHRPGRGLPMHVVLSSRAWTTYFGSDPNIIGTTIRIGELRPGITVIGVAPPELDVPHGADVWFNQRLAPADETHFLTAIARLAPGASIDGLRAAAPAAMRAAAGIAPSADGREFVVRTLVDATVGDLRPVLLLVLVATLLVLVLACVNVATLLLSRATMRGREFALRAAVGASRGRVVRQLLTEALVLTSLGAAAGVAVTWAALHGLGRFGLASLPRLEHVPVDGRVLGFAIGTILVTVVVAGLVPLWQLWSTDVRSVLQAGGRTTTAAAGTSRVLSLLVGAQVAAAIAVVCAAGWLTESYARLRGAELGFATAHRLIVDVRPAHTFASGREAHDWWDAALARVQDALGDTAPVALASSYPLRTVTINAATIALASEPADDARQRTSRFESVSPRYFRAMGIGVDQGRAFTVDDREDTEPVAIVNRAFLQQFFAERPALDEGVSFGFPTPDRQRPRRIVGVVDDVRAKSLADPPEATIYVPRAQWPHDYTRAPIVVDAGLRPLADVREQVRAVLLRDEPSALLRMSTADAIVDDATRRQAVGRWLMAAFGLTALVLAGVGVYGVIAYAVSRRGPEIAARLAFGATRSQVFWLLLRRGLRLASLGTVAGLSLASLAGQGAASAVFEVQASTGVLVASAGLVLAMTLVAIAIPSLRASRQNLSDQLRAE